MNGFGKKLNESFNTYFKKLNESNFEEFDNMTKEPVLEFPNGEYFYVDVDKENNLIFAGSATNNGIIREFEIEYDFDDTLDGNLSRLYDTIIEERPELLDEEPIDESLSFNPREIQKVIKELEHNFNAEFMFEHDRGEGYSGLVFNISNVKDKQGFKNFIKDYYKIIKTKRPNVIMLVDKQPLPWEKNESLNESLGATDLVRDLYSKFNEIDLINERDLGENIGLIYDISKLKDKNKFKEYIKEYKVKPSKNNPNKIMIIVKEDEEDIDESYDKKQLIAAVKDAYGFTTKEANNWIKNADEASKEEIVKGFKSNSSRSFLTDSLKEDLDKYQKHPDRYNIKLSKLKDTVEDYFKTTNGDATIILNGEYYNIINESVKKNKLKESGKSYLKEANKYDSKMENEIRKTMKKYGVDDEDIDKAVKDNKHRRRMTDNEVSDNGQRANIDRYISDFGHDYKTPAEKALLKHDRHHRLTHVGPNNEFKVNSSSQDRLVDTFVKLKNELENESLNEELTYDDVQYMNDSERHDLFKKYHKGNDFESEDDFWDWAEEEFPFEEIDESLNEGFNEDRLKSLLTDEEAVNRYIGNFSTEFSFEVKNPIINKELKQIEVVDSIEINFEPFSRYDIDEEEARYMLEDYGEYIEDQINAMSDFECDFVHLVEFGDDYAVFEIDWSLT